jgi:hypothetical protein
MGFTKLYLLILFIDRLWLTILRLMFPRYQIGFRSGAKKHLSDTECTTFRSWAKQHLSVAIIPLKIAFLRGTDRCFFTSESYPLQCKSYTRISMYKTFSETINVLVLPCRSPALFSDMQVWRTIIHTSFSLKFASISPFDSPILELKSVVLDEF